MSIKTTSKITQATQKVAELEQKIYRFTHMIGYKSQDTIKSLKSLLTLVNSLAIVFLYHGLLSIASKILKKALNSDVYMFFNGSKGDKKWHGRVLLYCNLSFLLMKGGDATSALKFLYDSESLLIDISQEEEFTDIKLASSVIGFFNMCRIGKLSTAHDYLESATEQFNSIIREEVLSRYTSEACANMYSCFTFAGEILKDPKAVNNFPQFRREIEEKYMEVNNEAGIFLHRLLTLKDWSSGLEIICSNEWTDFTFLIVFFPFISNTTPIIDIEEILKEKSRNRRAADMSGFLSQKKNGKGFDTYGFLMKSALESLK